MLIGLLAAGLSIWDPGPPSVTADEPLWLIRADTFRTALRSADLEQAASYQPFLPDAPSTQPGITTMAIGAVAQDTVRLADRFGVIDVDVSSTSGMIVVLRAAQILMSLACAVALGILVWCLSLTIGRRPATIAGVLLAAEPFLLGHMGVLHTDALLTLLSGVSVAALAAVLLSPTDPGRRRTALLVAVSSVAGALAVLTKLLGVVALGTVVPLVIVASIAVARRHGRPLGRAVRRIALVMAAWGALAAALFVGGQPRMWVAPRDTIDRLMASSRIADGAFPVFFRGEVRGHADPWLVPVTMLFRMSPWLLVGGAISIVVVGVWMVRPPADAPPRAVMAVWLLWPVTYLLFLATRSKVYDRYALPVWLTVAVVVALVVDAVLRQRAVEDRVLVTRGALAVGLVGIVAVAATTAPHRTAYVNRLVGQQRAVEIIALGWGEGIAEMGAVVDARERPRGRCDEVELFVPLLRSMAFPCGSWVSEPTGLSPTYAIRTVSHQQRPGFDQTDPVIDEQDFELVDSVEIRGVVYVELWYADGLSSTTDG